LVCGIWNVKLSELLAKQPLNILLGVTGGIAAYKAADLVRRLKENQFNVRVVMTQGAKSFITPMTMQAVSGNPVHDELFDQQAEAAMGHIELAKWADIILIAPATANIIAKIAAGFSDDLLTTLILASSARLMVVPAMNQQMWANKATKENIERLIQREVLIFGPASGEQACGDVGEGRMLEPLEIVEQLLLSSDSANAESTNEQNLKGRNILITAGPTVEAIDPVRFISNHSSGKMGYALAKAAVLSGANVTLISGPVDLDISDKVNRISVTSASEMLAAVQNELASCDVFIGCAAVADYAPVEFSEHKIKKNNQDMLIALKKTPDIISWVAAQEKRPFVVGFAAESQNLEVFATNKLINKKLDMICANDISDTNLGFNSDDNKILIIGKNGNQLNLPAAPKLKIAKAIMKEIGKNINSNEN